MPETPSNTQYSDAVLSHFSNPHNVGEIAGADGVGNVGNPVCGDVMRLTLKIEDGKIVDAKFKTFGCGAAIATSSMVTDLVKGKTVEEALKIFQQSSSGCIGRIAENQDALFGFGRRSAACRH